MSEYELKRQARLQHNQEVMRRIGLFPPMDASEQAPAKRSTKAKPALDFVPMRKSSRTVVAPKAFEPTPVVVKLKKKRLRRLQWVKRSVKAPLTEEERQMEYDYAMLDTDESEVEEKEEQEDEEEYGVSSAVGDAAAPLEDSSEDEVDDAPRRRKKAKVMVGGRRDVQRVVVQQDVDNRAAVLEAHKMAVEEMNKRTRIGEDATKSKLRVKIFEGRLGDFIMNPDSDPQGMTALNKMIGRSQISSPLNFLDNFTLILYKPLNEMPYDVEMVSILGIRADSPASLKNLVELIQRGMHG